MTLDVVPRINDLGALEVLASPEPGGRYYWASNGGLPWVLDNETELLVWLADEVQEATMERDQVNVFVWPGACARVQRRLRWSASRADREVQAHDRDAVRSESLYLQWFLSAGCGRIESMFERLSPNAVIAAALIAPPGADVITALAGIDPLALDAGVRVDLMVAWERQSAWVTARGVRVIAAVGAPRRLRPSCGTTVTIHRVISGCVPRMLRSVPRCGCLMTGPPPGSIPPARWSPICRPCMPRWPPATFPTTMPMRSSTPPPACLPTRPVGRALRRAAGPADVHQLRPLFAPGGAGRRSGRGGRPGP